MLTSKQYYIFDPIQFKEFGYRFFDGGDFYYRYQFSKKFFLKNIYIPFGPNCKKEKDFDDFLKHLSSFHFTKITLDLPMIYDNKISGEVVKKLEASGFKKIPYVHQDEETILLSKKEFKLNSKRMNQVNHGYKFANIVVKEELTKEEIDEIYKIYLLSSQRIGFIPKNKEVFVKLSENCLVSLACDKSPHLIRCGDKENKKIEGYVFGYLAGNILLIMFTGITDYGRRYALGHALHYDLFNEAFKNQNVDMVDFHGASRTKKRSYVAFKQEWGGKFYSLPGSFTKTFLL